MVSMESFLKGIEMPAIIQAIAPKEFSLVELFKGNGSKTIDISNRLYHADKSCVSSSALKELLRSPAHYHAYLSGERSTETPAMLFGTAVHTRLLEPDVYATEYVVSPFTDRRSKESKEFELANASRQIITQEQADLLERISDSVSSHKTANHLIKSGLKEQTIIWQDRETGIWLKIRPDCLSIEEGICLDVKKTQDATPDAFGRTCVNYDYDVQAALYLMGLREVMERDFDFAFLAVEERPPCGCALYAAPLEMLHRGTIRVRKALYALAECRETGEWPSYQPHGNYDLLSWPSWAR